jgi:hypothetical protein
MSTVNLGYQSLSGLNLDAAVSSSFSAHLVGDVSVGITNADGRVVRLYVDAIGASRSLTGLNSSIDWGAEGPPSMPLAQDDYLVIEVIGISPAHTKALFGRVVARGTIT